MLWIIETKNGVFEANTKRKVINQMIEHFGDNGRDATIKAIYCQFRDGRTDKIYAKGRHKIQKIIDNGISEYREQMEENQGAKAMLNQDYYSNLC
jgi:hypothetical protein